MFTDYTGKQRFTKCFVRNFEAESLITMYLVYYIIRASIHLLIILEQLSNGMMQIWLIDFHAAVLSHHISRGVFALFKIVLLTYT